MQFKQIISILVVVIVLGGIAVGLKTLQPKTPAPTVPVTTFEECVAAGNPVMESYPRQCAAGGKTFVEEIPTPTPDPNETGGGLGLQANGCAVAGCSGEVCVSADEAGNIATTCEFRPEYACYRDASCEPQSNGKCGWTPTPKLTACLQNPPMIE